MVVDLPAPFKPIKPTACPGSIVKFTFLMTLIPEYPPVKFSILSAITFSSLLQ